jgi:predicted MPP superfamily phosphohydrolase
MHVRHVWLALAMGAALALVAAGALQARSDPIVRSLDLKVPYPIQGQVSVLFMSDFHVHGPDMSPDRLRGIVLKLNALRPDLVILGGDYRSTVWLASSYSLKESIQPLGLLKAKYGVVAVLGNHDQPDSLAVRAELTRAGIQVVADEAKAIGPVSIGGIDRRVKYTARELQKLPGPRILVAHSPESLLRFGKKADLLLAGHTHCGQIVLPLLGQLSTGGKIPRSHACGFSKLHNVPLIVTAGLGTSKLPLRFGAHPDVWLISLSGSQEPAQAATRN